MEVTAHPPRMKCLRHAEARRREDREEKLRTRDMARWNSWSGFVRQRDNPGGHRFAYLVKVGFARIRHQGTTAADGVVSKI